MSTFRAMHQKHVNPRPDGVWWVTRPDGEEAKAPHLISSKVIVVAEKFKRRWKDLVELYKINHVDLILWPVTSQEGQTVLIYSSQLFVT